MTAFKDFHSVSLLKGRFVLLSIVSSNGNSVSSIIKLVKTNPVQDSNAQVKECLGVKFFFSLLFLCFLTNVPQLQDCAP